MRGLTRQGLLAYPVHSDQIHIITESASLYYTIQTIRTDIIRLPQSNIIQSREYNSPAKGAKAEQIWERAEVGDVSTSVKGCALKSSQVLRILSLAKETSNKINGHILLNGESADGRCSNYSRTHRLQVCSALRGVGLNYADVGTKQAHNCTPIKEPFLLGGNRKIFTATL